MALKLEIRQRIYGKEESFLCRLNDPSFLCKLNDPPLCKLKDPPNPSIFGQTVRILENYNKTSCPNSS